jgi:hypothetical protein
MILGKSQRHRRAGRAGDVLRKHGNSAHGREQARGQWRNQFVLDGQGANRLRTSAAAARNQLELRQSKGHTWQIQAAF